MAASSLFNRWVNMKQRCLNPKNTDYKDYGGRGIKICPEWLSSFYSFKAWALTSGFESNLKLDRENTNGNYEPINCRWVTDEVQANNKRNVQLYFYKGAELSLAQICRVEGLDKRKIWHRVIKQKMSLLDAVELGDNRKHNKQRENTLKFKCEKLGLNYNAVKLRKSRFSLSENDVINFYLK